MCSLRESLSPETKEFTSEPLDKLKVDIVDKQGSPKTVPALSAGFVKPKTFVVYKQPVSVFDYSSEQQDEPLLVSAATVEEWLERLEFIKEDLHWLLRLPYHRFWSQVLYYDGVHKSLESYLSNSPRYYDLHYLMFTEEMKQAHQMVHKLVFMVYLRMSTYKESKLSHITPEYFGNMIYDNYIFDIPKIMDLCVLYGKGNHALLNKMINNLFTVQPRYLEDLEHVVPTVLQAFVTVQNKLGLGAVNKDEEEKLNELLHPPVLSSMPLIDLQDIVNYLVDTSATLSAFLDIYPLACHPFHKEGTAARISAFYEAVFPQLQNELKCRNSREDIKLLSSELKKRIVLAKSCLVKIFRNIIATCCIHPLIECSAVSNKSSESKDTPYLEDLLEILSIAITEKSFITAYQQLYPFEEDLDIISQASFNIDQTRVEYILSGIYSSYENFDESKRYPMPAASSSQASIASQKSSGTPYDSSSSFLQSAGAGLINGSLPIENECSENFAEGASAGPKLKGSKLESLVHQVLDVLPDLQPSFAETCLEYYNYDFEKVINAILEQSLPSFLSLQQNLSREEENIGKNPTEDEMDSLLSGRRNVYDNDEFDVFSRETIDVSRIHKGKRDSTPKDFGELQDDVEHKKVLKDVCERYGLTEVYVAENTFLYEDEYDDTYDSTAVGLEEPPEEDEINIRPFTTPRVLETKKAVSRSESEESDEQEEQNLQAKECRDQFVANPAELREKAEQRRQALADTRRSKPPHNVRGNARGQGQSDETLRNRRFKEKHKDFRSNHNRRNQADRKRQRGMIPT